MRRLLCFLLGLLFTTAQLYAQRTISGTVTDSSGKSIPGVTVKVTGMKIGTSTDDRGIFHLSVPQNAKSLEFSSIGFTTEIVAVPASGNVAMVLKSNSGVVNTEVVVTGFTKQQKSKFAGAASKIDEKAIENRPVGSFDQLLQGRVPGLLAFTSSGAPGTSSDVIIRGQNSIEGGTTPLYVVDGIPVEAQVFQSYNPNDFESIDVLRDATGTALYGSRGSAGVITVTTKRGAGGKMKLSYSAQFGQTSRPEFTFTPMTSPELLQAQFDYGKAMSPVAVNLPGWTYNKNNPAYATLPATSPASNPYAPSQARYDFIYDSISKINTNWSDVFFRDGNFSNHQLSVSGGVGKTRVYSSLGYYNEDGITYRSNMKRATWRNNFDYADDKLSFQISSNLGYTKRNTANTPDLNTNNPFLSTNLAPPTSRLYLPGDTLLATGNGSSYIGANAYEISQLDKGYSDQAKVTMSTNWGYKITNELSLNFTGGIDFRETQASSYGNSQVYIRKTSSSVTTKAGSQSESLTRFFQADVRPSISYRKIVAEKHDFDVAVYGEYIKTAEKSISMTGYGIDPRTPNTPAAITPGNAGNQLYSSVGGSKGEGDLISGLVIGRYTYDGKYTFNGSFRRDGSSKLPEDTRWQNFFSVGGVWEMTREDFLKNSSIFSTLRLKASYGGAGNADNFPGGYYPYQATNTTGSYSGLTTQYQNYPGNKDMKWETTWTTNLGVDFGLLKGRIWGDVNVYDRRTRDLFVQKTLSATSGFGAIAINAGELQNKGIEVALNVDVVRTKDLTVTLNGNFAYNHNELLDLGGEQSYEQGTELLKVGQALGTHYEVKWGGVDAATGAPLYYDSAGKLTNNYTNAFPVQEFGTWEAPWKGGFGGSVRYKAFELSTLFAWQRGATKADNLQYFVENPNGFLSAGYNQANTMRFWQKPGDIVNVPGVAYSVNFSSQYIHATDFLRWKDLMLTYTMPQSLVAKTKILSKVRVFVQGTNLQIWTVWRGLDPEAGAANLNRNEFPNPRKFTGGLDITF